MSAEVLDAVQALIEASNVDPAAIRGISWALREATPFYCPNGRRRGQGDRVVRSRTQTMKRPRRARFRSAGLSNSRTVRSFASPHQWPAEVPVRENWTTSGRWSSRSAAPMSPGSSAAGVYPYLASGIRNFPARLSHRSFKPIHTGGTACITTRREPTENKARKLGHK